MTDDQINQQDQNNKHCSAAGQNPLRIHNSKLLRYRFVILCIFHHIFRPHSPDKKPVGVNSIRGTRDQSHMIFTLDNIQVTGLIRKHRLDLIHLVGKMLAKNVQDKNISLFHLIQICKKLCVRKTSMRRQNRMGALASDRKTGALHMAHTLFPGPFCSVRDRSPVWL